MRHEVVEDVSTKESKRIFWLFGLFVLSFFIAGGICAGVMYFGSKNEPEAPVAVEPEPEPDPVPVSAETRWLFAGTTFWGRDTNTMARASELGIKYPFSQLDTLNKQDYDAWIMGLECPLVEKGGVHNAAEEQNLFKFNCDPDYLEEAKKWFDVAGLGNNHAGNQGLEGLRETRQHLADNSIQYFGTPKRTAADTKDTEYRNDETDIDNCSVIVLPVRAKMDKGEDKTYKVPFAFCSAHGVYGVPGEDFLLNMKTYAEYLPTIAMPHMGTEYKAASDTLRENLYHKMIDYGVENVIADHPHWVQNAEAYNGKLITYSLGNFMFDQKRDEEVSRSAAIDATISVAVKDVDMDAWNKIGEKCLAQKDGKCFEMVKEAGLPKLKLTWTYDYHGTTSAQNRIPRLASEAEQAKIGQRLNWAGIPDELKTTK